MLAIDQMREKASLLSIGLIWITAGLICARAVWGTDANEIVMIAGALLLGVSATATWRASRTGPVTRLVTGMNQAMCVALLVYGFTGSSLQIDMHMYFFAALGVTAVWIDWRPIIAFTAVTAVHHLLFYVFIPYAVFPGESDFTRVVLHAVILLVEAFALIHMSRIVNASFSASSEALRDAETAREKASMLLRENEQTKQVADQERGQRQQEDQARMKDVTKIVDTLAEALRRFASGDLTTRIDMPFGDEFERIRTDFNKSAGKLARTIAELKDASRALDAHSTEISSATVQLSQRTESQAASSDEIMVALEDLSVNINNMRKNSDTAKSTARTANETSENSSEIVAEAIGAMGRIEKVSGEISSILSVIDEIAFQTNLLALNAGVEAARAGEAGSGFAVVAQEVRDLAQRSAEAAKEIKDLIGKSEIEVTQGVEIVQNTGDALNRISSDISSITAQIDQMFASSENQVSSLTELSGLMSNITSATQQNAAMAEETGSASLQLKDAIASLNNAMSEFEVGTVREEEPSLQLAS